MIVINSCIIDHNFLCNTMIMNPIEFEGVIHGACNDDDTEDPRLMEMNRDVEMAIKLPAIVSTDASFLPEVFFASSDNILVENPSMRGIHKVRQ